MFVEDYFREHISVAEKINKNDIEALCDALVNIRDRNGRLFILGVGGSAGNASHATNDFRKLCGIETYCPTDNVSELTARTNDEGWHTIFSEWLINSKLCDRDGLLIFSVGGGNKERNVSTNLINATDLAKDVGATILGIVGKPDGHVARNGSTVIVVPEINNKRVTPHSESFQAVVWHCLVSHPKLQIKATKW